ncbi:MAG TPA: C1 family peptidase [Pseudolabrys sp.]|jgi:hypothetical protein|nr:C1 family peptidase [Pseudolabrys sp.]
MSKRRYGWRPELPSFKRRKFSIRPPVTVDHVDRMGLSMPIDDQLQTSSCTGNSAGWLTQYVTKSPPLSRFMAYYDGRIPEGATGSDEGATIGDVVAGIFKYGLCVETIWPFNPAAVDTKPNLAAYAFGRLLKPKLKSCTAIGDLNTIKHELAAGSPVVFGFSVPDWFEGTGTGSIEQTGWCPLPSEYDQIIGGHAVVAVGFDDRPAKPFVWVRNSWGTGWGYQGSGYFQMDQAWFTDPRRLTDDAWTIQGTP